LDNFLVLYIVLVDNGQHKKKNVKFIKINFYYNYLNVIDNIIIIVN